MLIIPLFATIPKLALLRKIILHLAHQKGVQAAPNPLLHDPVLGCSLCHELVQIKHAANGVSFARKICPRLIVLTLRSSGCSLFDLKRIACNSSISKSLYEKERYMDLSSLGGALAAKSSTGSVHLRCGFPAFRK